MAGLLASALGGAGKAIQANAQAEIKRRKEAALMELRHRNDMTRQDDQQSFQTDERVAGQQYQKNRDERLQDYEQDNIGLRHNNAMTQERYAQGQQNDRTLATIDAQNRHDADDWQLMSTENGRYVQYSPSRNETRDANLPAGVGAAGGDLTDRQKYRLDNITGQMESIRSRASDQMREPTAEEKMQLGSLEAQYNAILGGGQGGMTVFEQLMAGELSTDQQTAGVEGAQQDAEQQDSVRGILRRQQAARQRQSEIDASQQKAEQARDRADDVLGQLERLERDQRGRTPGVLGALVNPPRRSDLMDEAQQAARELLTLDRDPNLSADQKRWIAESLVRLQQAGVAIDLQQ
ncbi:hypothetical protein [Kushneria aurantia]|uniref:DNA pilot protein n=1 Tax=Kushneria aurantia TaxID=504092 RepID=A0ABV6G4L1_9GAMM|nr:hypothetical protein [Kushneria aurantia]